MLNFSEHTELNYWKMCPSVRVFTCGFSTAVPQHIAVVRCISGCTKVILEAGLASDLRLQFPVLHAHLT
jgi:hypothetical protein